MDKVKEFLEKSLTNINGFDLKVWYIIVAAVALLLIIAVIIMSVEISRKNKKKAKQAAMIEENNQQLVNSKHDDDDDDDYASVKTEEVPTEEPAPAYEVVQQQFRQDIREEEVDEVEEEDDEEEEIPQPQYYPAPTEDTYAESYETDEESEEDDDEIYVREVVPVRRVYKEEQPVIMAEKKPVNKPAPAVKAAAKPAPVKKAASAAKPSKVQPVKTVGKSDLQKKPVPIAPAVAKKPAPAATAKKATVETKPLSTPKAPAAKPAPVQKTVAKPAPAKKAPVAPKAAPVAKKTAPVAAKSTTSKKAPAPKTVPFAPKVMPVKKDAKIDNVDSKNITLLGNEPAAPLRGKYAIVKGDNPIKPYVFQLRANNGQVLYESEGYKAKPKKASIIAFQNTVTNGVFAIDSEKNGSYRYKLYKEDGTLLGVGESYRTKDRAESAAESVKAFALSANFIEDLT